MGLQGIRTGLSATSANVQTLLHHWILAICFLFAVITFWMPIYILPIYAATSYSKLTLFGPRSYLTSPINWSRLSFIRAWCSIQCTLEMTGSGSDKMKLIFSCCNYLIWDWFGRVTIIITLRILICRVFNTLSLYLQCVSGGDRMLQLIPKLSTMYFDANGVRYESPRQEDRLPRANKLDHLQDDCPSRPQWSSCTTKIDQKLTYVTLKRIIKVIAVIS